MSEPCKYCGKVDDCNTYHVVTERGLQSQWKSKWDATAEARISLAKDKSTKLYERTPDGDFIELTGWR